MMGTWEIARLERIEATLEDAGGLTELDFWYIVEELNQCYAEAYEQDGEGDA